MDDKTILEYQQAMLVALAWLSVENPIQARQALFEVLPAKLAAPFDPISEEQKSAERQELIRAYAQFKT